MLSAKSLLALSDFTLPLGWTQRTNRVEAEGNSSVSNMQWCGCPQSSSITTHAYVFLLFLRWLDVDIWVKADIIPMWRHSAGVTPTKEKPDKDRQTKADNRCAVWVRRASLKTPDPLLSSTKFMCVGSMYTNFKWPFLFIHYATIYYEESLLYPPFF